jgi:hypothetical protein
MDHQSSNKDDDDDFMLRESVRMSIKAGMSLMEALAIDSVLYRNSVQPHQQPQLPPSFKGEIDDKMVHPLDISPLLLQTRSRTQPKYGFPTGPSPTPMISSSMLEYVSPLSHTSPSTAQQAWDETCVGLGLTLTTPSNYQEPHHAPSVLTEESEFPRRPIPRRYHQLDRSGDTFAPPPPPQQQNQQQYEHLIRRPEMTTKSTSGLTTHTLQSDATLNSGSYATSATSSTHVDMSFTNHHSSYPYYPMSSSSSQCNNYAINDYEQDTTTTYRHHPQHHCQHPQQHPQRDRQYFYSQRHEQQDSPFFRRDYNDSVQRQPSQRNKKNLVVNISPPTQMY